MGAALINDQVNRSQNRNERCKGLKATNEEHNDGTGVLHQVAQFPVDQVYYIQGAHAPLCPRKTKKDKELAAE